MLYYSLCVLQEHVKITFASTLTKSLFEICVRAKLLILKETKHWETT
jgi:hypothetical protein